MASWDIYTYTGSIAAGLLAATDFMSGGYRPLLWGLQSVMLKTSVDGHIFDAVIREEHTSALTITQHPVQTGANITDHAYQMPANLVLDVGISDSMASFRLGEWEGTQNGNILEQIAGNLLQSVTGGLLRELLGVGPTKSTQAFQILQQIQSNRSPLTVITQYRSYKNMLIERIVTPKDWTNQANMKCSIFLRQILMAQVPTTTSKSSDPQTTNSTPKTDVQPSASTNSSFLYQYLPGGGQ